jgi:RHS repeat-associated protein
VPDPATGALGLIGLELNPNTIYTRTYTVVDNTATTITVAGDMTQAAAAGDSYVGEYHFNSLSVINGAQVSTDDDVYFDSLDVTGGVLNANNVYQSGMADPSMMLALDFSEEMGILKTDKVAVAKLARLINRQQRKGQQLSRRQMLLTSLNKKTTAVRLDAFSNKLYDMTDILKIDASPLDVVDKRIIVAGHEQGDISPDLYASQDELVQTILLAQVEGTVVADAGYSVQPGNKKQPLAVDPSYTYDLNGNRITMTDPTGVTYYAYDALNRLTKITNPNGEITSYTYDAVGRRTGMTYANSIITSYQYDAAGRLLSLVHKLGAAQVATFSYTYDAVGNRTSMTDEYGVHNYVYDVLYRLTQATHPQPTNPLEGFDYDAVGNRYPATNVYNAANQLLEDDTYIYSYDRNGNTVSKTNKVTAEYTRYYWNAENQMTKLEKYAQAGDTTPTSTVSYIYDGLGRRVAKNVDGVATKYLYDNEDILLEMDETNNILARYTHGPGIDEPISMERAGSSYYYVADGLGSIAKLVDAAGMVVNSYVYDSFGNIVEKTEAVANFYTYTAREYDAESGLYYYRARYYDANTGRFLRPDCIMATNLYIYAANNPIKNIDPYGLKWIAHELTDAQYQVVKSTIDMMGKVPGCKKAYDRLNGSENWWITSDKTADKRPLAHYGGNTIYVYFNNWANYEPKRGESYGQLTIADLAVAFTHEVRHGINEKQCPPMSHKEDEDSAYNDSLICWQSLNSMGYPTKIDPRKK